MQRFNRLRIAALLGIIGLALGTAIFVGLLPAPAALVGLRSAQAATVGSIYVGSEGGNYGPGGSYQGYVYAFNGTGSLLWTAQVNGGVDSSPAVYNGVVYVGANDDYVYAFSASCSSSCTPLWSYKTGGMVISSPTGATVTINGTPTPVVYIGSDDGTLYAFNANCRSACTPIWSYQTGGPIVGTPAVATATIAGVTTQIVCFGSYDENVYALYADGQPCNGSVVAWTYQTQDAVASSPAVLAQTIAGVATPIIFIGSDDDNVYALYGGGANAGQRYWLYSIPDSTFVRSSPTEATVTIGNTPTDIVFVGADDGTLYALYADGAKAGALLWRYQTGNNMQGYPGSYIDGRPVVGTGNAAVFFGSYDHNVYGLSTSTGALVYTLSAADVVAGSPAVANGNAIFGAADYNSASPLDSYHLYDYNMNFNWATPLQYGPVFSAPTVGP
jgi:outer membrane protein assembly factor BamB